MRTTERLPALFNVVTTTNPTCVLLGFRLRNEHPRSFDQETPRAKRNELRLLLRIPDVGIGDIADSAAAPDTARSRRVGLEVTLTSIP